MANKQVTSLSQQLKKLQVPQAQTLLNADNKRRVSFLYDPKEAANLDSESVHCLAINGLEQLKLIDEKVFSTFEETLFNSTSITFERSIQTKEVNENLNSEIKRFFINLSPYFLLKPAHKTIEWLVYKYQVHYYNINELMMCILPYYENQLFIRAIQMISNLEQNKLWSWLENNQKSGVPVASQTFAQHVISDLSFLNFLIDYTNDCLNGYKGDDYDTDGYLNNGVNLCSSFLTKTFIQALNSVKTPKLSDTFISQLLPFLYNLLKHQQPNEFKNSAYLIVTILFQRFTFNKETCEKTLISLIKSLVDKKTTGHQVLMANNGFRSAFIACCLLIKSQVKSQFNRSNFFKSDIEINEGSNFITKSFLKKLFKVAPNQDELLNYLSTLKQKYDIDEFLKQFFDRLLQNLVHGDADFSQNETLLIKFVSQISFRPATEEPNEDLEMLLNYMIRTLFYLLAHLNDQEAEENAAKIGVINELLKTFERKYPLKFDSILNDLLEGSKLNSEFKQKLQTSINFYTMSFKTAFKYNYLSDFNANLTVCLQHTNDHIRASSLEYVHKYFDSNTEIDESFVKSQLELKLDDNSLHVMKVLLKFKLNLLKFFSFKELTSKLIGNLFHSYEAMEVDNAVEEDEDELFEVRKQVISFIFNDLYLNLVKTTEMADVQQQYCEILTDLVLTLFENYIKTPKQQIFDLFSYLAETKLFKQNESIFNFMVKSSKPKKEGLMNSVISYYNGFKTVLIKNFKEFLTNSYLSDTVPTGNKLSLSDFFKFDILIQLIQHDSSVKLKEKCFSLLKSFNSKLIEEKKSSEFMKILKNEVVDDQDKLNGYITAIKTDKIELSIYLSEFKTFLKVINKTDDEINGEIYSYLCLKSSNRNLCFIYLTQYFLRLHFEDKKESLLQFLLKFVTSRSSGVDGITHEVLLLRSLQLINVNFLTKEETNDALINSIKNVDLINQLILMLAYNLSDKHEMIRSEAMSCLRQLKSNFNHDLWSTFIKKMVKNSEEVLLDGTYLTGDGIQKKCQLNKYLSTDIMALVGHFIQKRSNIVVECLKLLRNIDLDLKYSLFQSIVNYLGDASHQNSDAVGLIFENYLINEKTGAYFNTNEAKFESLVLKSLTDGELQHVSTLLNQLISQDGFFNSLNQSLKLKLIEKLFNLYDSKRLNLTTEIQTFFFNLVNDSILFIHLLNQINPSRVQVEGTAAVEVAKSTKELKKQMKKTTGDSDNKAADTVVDVNKLRLIIELIQLKLNRNSSNLTARSSLLSILFENLNFIFEKQQKDHQPTADNEETYEYIQVSILDSILEIYKSNQNSSENQFNVELLIQILKLSQNIRVQQKILLLLSELASKYPDKILENVLVMFVFVGNKLIRKDDQYSLNIITTTINTIIPEILKAKTVTSASGTGHNINPIVCKILQSFVITLPYIPNHRKVLIFNDLLNLIGTDTYLWVIILQLFDYYFIENKKADEKNDKKLRDTLKQCSQILVTLFNQFKFENILQSVVYLIEFLNKFDFNSQKTAQNSNKMPEYEFLNIKLDEYSIMERKYLIYNLIQLVNELLIGNFTTENTHGLFENLIEHLLIGIINLNKKQQQFTNEDDLKFIKAILNKYYDCMENLILNLNICLFINIIRKLIKHEQFQIKRRILVLLNNKLRKQDFVDDTESTQLLTLLDDLISEIRIDPTGPQKLTNELEINNQTILFTIKLLTKRIGDKNSIAFMKVLKYLADNLINKKLYFIEDDSKLVNQNFLASVLLCIGELCSKLKSSCLIYLNQIATFIFDIIHLDEILGNDLLVLSSITCLFKISQNLANFLSPYLKRLVYASCTLQYKKIIQDQLTTSMSVKNSISHQNISISSDIGMEIDAYINQTNASQPNSPTQSKSMQQIDFKLSQLRNCLATSIPLRLIVPVLNDELTSKNETTGSLVKDTVKIDTIEYYMQIIKMAVQNSTQEDIMANIRLLKSLFMNLFNLRTLYSNNKAPNDLCKSEDHIIDTFSELTFKLSEETFRPMFFSLVEWATMNDPPKDRLITFYRISFKLSAKLKNLFVLFTSHFIKNAVDTLDLLNVSKTNENFFLNKKERTKYIYANDKSRLLLLNISDTLTNVFLHDTDKFILSNDRFNVLMQPLVDQIENEIEYDNYKKYINEHVTPCIANFAVLCIHDTTLCRKLNYQILLKTKSSSAQVRLASLDVLKEVSKKWGDIYNSIFTETAPFLAELMEDPVEEIEEKVHALIKELEDMLGESLQGHFV